MNAVAAGHETGRGLSFRLEQVRFCNRRWRCHEGGGSYERSTIWILVCIVLVIVILGMHGLGIG
jgi:hypothetical protein